MGNFHQLEDGFMYKRGAEKKRDQEEGVYQEERKIVYKKEVQLEGGRCPECELDGSQRTRSSQPARRPGARDPPGKDQKAW